MDFVSFVPPNVNTNNMGGMNTLDTFIKVNHFIKLKD